MLPINLRKQKQLLFPFPCAVLFPEAVPPPGPLARSHTRWAMALALSVNF